MIWFEFGKQWGREAHPATNQIHVVNLGSPLHQFSHPTGTFAAQSGDIPDPNASHPQAISQEPRRAGADAPTNPAEKRLFAATAAIQTQDCHSNGAGSQGAAPAPAGDCPQNAQKATEDDALGLAGIVSLLREELAAQREENARLRETLSALALALARQGGGGGPSADQ